MTKNARRSWLLLPMSKPERIPAATGADVVVLDLVELVAERDKHVAREQARTAIDAVRALGAEAFAMIDPELAYADLHACVWPGLSGVVVSRAESAAQIREISALIAEVEARHGLLPESVQIVVGLETARGNQDAYEILTASPRVWGATLGRADLIMDLRPEPSGEIHLMPYLMQRLVIVAGAAGVTPLGAWWRAPDRGLLASAEATLRAGERGRAIGFKGALCLRHEQVSALNRAYG